LSTAFRPSTVASQRQAFITLALFCIFSSYISTHSTLFCSLSISPIFFGFYH
jgi:hypothetical protein